jgi:putative membrane protein
MKCSILITISMAALALASCGKKAEPTVENSSVNAVNTAVVDAAPALSAGQIFANTAAASDTFEIETSKLAVSSAASSATKAFAQSMIKAHTDSTTKLKAAAGAAPSAITPDPTLTAEQLQTLEALKGKEGAEFDKAYEEAQTKAHQMTLDTLKSYAASGDVPSLKAFASSMVPIVTAHLNMAKGLKH